MVNEFSGFSEMADELRDFKRGIASVRRRVRTAINRGMGQTARAMSDEMRRRVPVRTGKTRNSIEVKNPVVLTWIVKVGGAAVHIEYGTDPHTIEADSAAALRFQWPSAPIPVYEAFAGSFPVVFFKEIDHPGTPRQPFFHPSYNKHKDSLRENVNAELAKEFGKEFA